MTSGEFNHHRYHTNWYHEIYAYEPNELAKTGMREFSFDLNPPQASNLLKLETAPVAFATSSILNSFEISINSNPSKIENEINENEDKKEKN